MSAAQKCEHGFCGMVRKERELKKRWIARLAVVAGPRRVLVCESCRGPVVNAFRENGVDVSVTLLDPYSFSARLDNDACCRWPQMRLGWAGLP